MDGEPFHTSPKEDFREISSLETAAIVCHVPLEEDDDLVLRMYR